MYPRPPRGTYFGYRNPRQPHPYYTNQWDQYSDDHFGAYRYPIGPFRPPFHEYGYPAPHRPYFQPRIPHQQMYRERTRYYPRANTRPRFRPPPNHRLPEKNTNPKATAACRKEADDKTSPEETVVKQMVVSGNADSQSLNNVTPVRPLVSPIHSVEHLDYNQREKLIHQLRQASYQCVICIVEVRHADPIWSCSTCFHIYHLSCIQSWAHKCCTSTESSMNASLPMWRCPSCQTKQETPSECIRYSCFCGRVQDPKFIPQQTSIPHGCDELCGKKRTKVSFDENDGYSSQMVCTHPCTELCHPGPCPPCISNVTMFCPCGRVKRSTLCGNQPPPPCGHVCGRVLLTGRNCATGVHVCLAACHVGECPPCPWVIETNCFCGLEKKSVTCGSAEAMKLNFTKEIIDLLTEAACRFQPTHEIETSLSTELEEQLKLECVESDEPSTPTGKLASKSDRVQEPPSVVVPPSFSCLRACGRPLTCGNHACQTPCHAGACGLCALDPSRCFTCPCGRVPLSKLVASGDPAGDRTSCLDPVPSCPNVCARPHPLCGHPCPVTCHAGPCPPCKLSITATCRCGRMKKELSCVRFEQESQSQGTLQLICERICNKKKPCGRHKCKSKCCDLSSHSCAEICGRRLACQQHNCEEPCHPGPCGTCWRGVIYTELYCRCHRTVLQPPQPCGSVGPECPHPCILPHNCDHPVRHTCHNEPTCPPCTVLMTKECPGGHGVQFSMPCFQPVLSCGRPCAKPLPNCSHLCQRICHMGACLDEAANTLACKQRCQKPRAECGHPCNQICHEASGLTCIQAAAKNMKDPSSTTRTLPPCQKMVNLICACGKRKDSRPCHQVQIRECMLALQSEGETPLFTAQQEPLRILACDSTCAATATEPRSDNEPAPLEMWQRGFDTVQGVKPDTLDVNSKTPFEVPEYSDYLRGYATKNYEFALSIEEQLYNIALQFLRPSGNSSGEPTRVLNHHFPPMNKRRRRFVRELAEHYGMDSYTFDAEPSRHVMILAKRGYIRFPGGAYDNRGSLLNCLRREGVILGKKTAPPSTTAILPASVVRSSYASVLRQGN